MPVDPSADDDHGEHVGEVSLEHLGHHGGVRHRVGLRHVPLLRLQDARLLVVEEVPTREEGLFRQVLAVFTETPTPNQSLTVLKKIDCIDKKRIASEFHLHYFLETCRT